MDNKEKILKKIMIGVFMLFLMTVLAACSNENQPPEEAEKIDLTKENNRQIEAFGKVKVPEPVKLSLKNPGRIEKVLVQEGQVVEKGETIIILDLSEQRQRMEEIAEEIAVVRAEMEASRRNLSQETMVIGQELEYAENRMQQVLREMERYQTLYKAGVIPKETLEEKEMKTEEQQQQVHSLELSLELKEDAYQLKVYRQRIQELEARKQGLQNQMEISYLKGDQLINVFEKSVVKDINKIAGDSIGAGEGIGKLLPLDRLEVEADVLEEFIRDVQVGSGVRFIPVADRSRTYHGKVTFIAGTAVVRNNETVIPIRVSIDDVDDFLKPEFNMDLYIDVE
ncbi:Multidrug resistance efflux pump [Tindallia magadiensis]|uniref:Multidrug resistance efflux pump n=1 Tax=Tindallia magadiensis TaxID=69895 RepID=A0A1I3E1R2_9FIRM|nr:efflux RND transporter periplasmic adaptor subunit [Tindallia magadiensis]SFH92906.1 Multidrug resistance efflux pump [Tindallia magadiensis]